MAGTHTIVVDSGPRHALLMMRTTSLLSLLLVAAIGTTAVAQDEQPDRPKIGLVLSGGGARGCTHVGVIKVLEELRIPVDFVVGNSMGALVGGAYAYGYSPQQMSDILTGIDWTFNLADNNRRSDLSFRRKQDQRNFYVDAAIGLRDWKVTFPKGLIRGHHTGNIIRFMVRDSYKIDHFDQLRIPYRCVAAEIGTGNEVVLEKGNLPLAMSASMAIPAAFAPVRIDGRDLVDGMVVNNIPIGLAKEMGADIVIAIDIGTPPMKPEEITTLFKVTGQMLSILMQKNVDEQLALLTDDDMLITPELGDMTSTDFGKAAEAIAIGEQTARALADQLRRYSVSEEEYAKFLEKQRRPETPAPVIGSVIIHNTSNLDDELVRSLMNTGPGQAFDEDVLTRDLERIFGTQDFERVTFELEGRDDGLVDLHLIADEKSWGPNYLRVGLNLVDDLDGQSGYNIGINITARALNRLGAEWRNELQVGEDIRGFTEFYQPLTTDQLLFVAPFLEYRDRPVTSYNNGRRQTEFDVTTSELGFDLGSILGNWGEIRLGFRRVTGNADVDLTSVSQSDIDFDDALFGASFTVDTVDEINFPNDGISAQASWARASTDAGADASYEAFSINGAGFVTTDKTTFGLAVQYETTLDKQRPIYRLARLGGLFNLSGFTQNELGDQHSFSTRLIVYHRVAGVRSVLLGLPIYVGGTIETGQVATRRDDLFDDLIVAGSGFLGIDSPVGPLYLGYGLAEGGRDSVYLFLGQTF